MPSPVFDMIRDAILNRKIVTASYNGHQRMMCPHIIGWNRRGDEQALFYQFAGQSASGLAPPGSGANWRCLALAGLTAVQISDGQWHTAPNYSRSQSCVATIAAEVAY